MNAFEKLSPMDVPIINFDVDEEEYLNKHVLALNGLLDY
jgi:hypothetical protein